MSNMEQRGWVLGGVCGMAVFAVAVVPFLPALTAEFTNWDDLANIAENPDFRGLSAAHFRWFWTTWHLGVYEPLSWMLKSLIYEASGEAVSASAFHGVSMALHGLNAAIFFAIAMVLLRRAMPDAPATTVRIGAFAAAMLFAWHPLRAEVVAWASGQSYALAAFFALIAVLAYVKTFADGEPTPTRRYLGLTIACIAYACACLSKTAAAPLAAVLLVLDVYPLRRFRRRALDAIESGRRPGSAIVLFEKLPLFAMAAAICAYAAKIGEHTRSEVSADRLNLIDRVVVAGHGVFFYLEKTFVPAGLSPLYALPLDFESPTARMWLGAGVAVLLTIGVVLMARRAPALAAAWAAYLIMLGPVSGLVRHGDQLAADRYAYMSMLGLILCAGAALAIAWERLGERGAYRGVNRAAAGVTGLLLLAALGNATHRQVEVWRDSERLWNQALAADPRNWLAQRNLANYFLRLRQQDRTIEICNTLLEQWPDYTAGLFTLGMALQQQDRTEEALTVFERVLEIDPKHEAFTNYGDTLNKLGRTEEAAQRSLARLRLTPDDVGVLNNLGVFLTALGREREALTYLRQAIDLRPRDTSAYFNSAMALAKQHKFAQAEEMLRRTKALNPRYPRLDYHLAYMLSMCGRRQDAVQAYRRAIESDRNDAASHVELGLLLETLGRDAEATSALREGLKLAPSNAAAALRYAWLLATSHDANARNGAAAVQIAERLATLTQRRNPQILLTLAAAYAETGRFAEAQSTAREAAALPSADPAQAETIRRAMAHFESHRPYRPPRLDAQP